MSQGLLKTKRRISSISSTQKITKAMELVATVKLKKWKDKMENMVSYLEEMNEIISSCSKVEDSEILELKHYKNAQSTLYVVVTSSLGLCGGYNYNLFKHLNESLKDEDKILVIGTKGLTKYKNDGNDYDDDYVSFLDKFDYSKVKELSNKIIDEYSKGIYKSIKLVSTVYVNSINFRPEIFNLLPLDDLSKDENNKKDIIFEPTKETVLELVIPKYINTFLYTRLTEALVCEQASRRNAMDNANDNAEELLGKLQIEFNKARQAAITQEITEVVGGANNKD